MYVFKDRGDRMMALRPEGTAGVVRAFVEHKLYATEELPYKVYYLQPAFRYERPQKGRYRQHTQFGLEAIGASLPENDAELILQIFHMYSSLGLQNFYFKLNCLGDDASRKKYVAELKKYFEPHLDELCEDCHARYEKNPLRILDCKVDCNKDFFKNAPKIGDFISEESKAKFQTITDYLEEYQVPYVLDPGLVRGLDYYSELVFEIYEKGHEDNGAIGAGGRYNSLVKELGGPDLPCVGFATGLERLIQALDDNHIFDQLDTGLIAYVMPLEKSVFQYAFNVAMHLRFNEIPTEFDYACRSLKAQFKSVDKKKAKFAILIGNTEMLASSVTIKNNETKEQKLIRVEDLVNFIMDELLKMQEAAEKEASHEGSCCCEEHADKDSCCCQDKCACDEHEHKEKDGCCHNGEHCECKHEK